MTIRLRLTIVYGLLFLAAGAALLTLSYGIVHHELPANQAVSVQDFRLRASKLASIATADDPDRQQLQQLIRAPDAEIAKLIQDPSPLPQRYVQSLVAELPSKVRSDALHTLLVASITALAVMVVLALVLGWIVAGRTLHPIGAITDTVRRLSADNLHERLDQHGPDDELKRLADTFDDLLGRLEAAFEGQRRFVANASHELRTPLTIMRTEIDVALRRPDTTNDELRTMAGIVRTTLERADRLITSLLALAAAQHGPEVNVPVDLAEVAGRAITNHRREADARTLTITTQLQAAPVIGDPGLIDRVAENLVDNAITHNLPNGWIQINTRADDGAAVLDVANSGPVIGGNEVDDLFEPFRRGGRTARSRTTGLGLSIVRSVVRAHHGTVTAEPLPDGGLRVLAQLPLWPGPDLLQEH